MSKIDFVGVQTQSKLLDISAAAHAVGISGISVAHNSITTGAPLILQYQYRGPSALLSSLCTCCYEAAFTAGGRVDT